jgi:hypothetical protein
MYLMFGAAFVAGFMLGMRAERAFARPLTDAEIAASECDELDVLYLRPPLRVEPGANVVPRDPRERVKEMREWRAMKRSERSSGA